MTLFSGSGVGNHADCCFVGPIRTQKLHSLSSVAGPTSCAILALRRRLGEHQHEMLLGLMCFVDFASPEFIQNKEKSQKNMNVDTLIL